MRPFAKWPVPVGPLAPKILHLGPGGLGRRCLLPSLANLAAAYSASLFLPAPLLLVPSPASSTPPLSCLANGYSYHNVCTLSTRSRPTALSHISEEEEEEEEVEGFG